MSLGAAHVTVGLVTALFLIGLLRLLVRRERVLPALATAVLLVTTSVKPPDDLETWSTAAFLAAFPLLLATFPDGRFVPGWTAFTMPVWVGSALAFLATGGRVAEQWWWTLLVLAQAGLLVAQVLRYLRRSSVDERMRTRWPLLACLVSFAGFSVVAILGDGHIGEGESLAVAVADVLGLLPSWGFALGLAAPTLVDVDKVLRGSFLAVVLLGLLLPAYAVTSWLAHTAGAGPRTAGWCGAVVVALLAGPAFLAARRVTERVLYRGRSDPMSTLVALGEQLQAGVDPLTVPDTVVHTVRHALGVDWAELRGDPTLAAIDGCRDGPGETFRMVFQGEHLADLVVGFRSGETSLDAHDRRVVTHLARQAAAAIHGTRALAQLLEARSRAVVAGEDERRRLRRDLHDDLAPTLAGLGLGAAAVERLAKAGDEDAVRVAADLHHGIRAASRQVREIAYDLRPPVLDDQGLVPAIRHRLATPLDTRPVIEILAPEGALDLSAAVELAALRIVLESVANVRRHAAASRCTVALTVRDGLLTIEVHDDGRGLPDVIRSGMGLRSIHERAAEVGGQATVSSSSQGTVVRAQLPASSSHGSAVPGPVP